MTFSKQAVRLKGRTEKHTETYCAGHKNMSENATEYTPTQALKCLDNISKNALYNDMKDGTLSYDERPKGKRTQRIIQGAELARVYGDQFKPLNTNSTSHENTTGRTETSHENTKTLHENNTLQVEVEVLRERIKDKDEIIEDLREDRDEWKDQAKKLLLQAPEKPIQAANENLGGVGGNPQKAIRSKNFAVFGGLIITFLLVGFLGLVFWPDIEARLNGVGVNEIAPAAGNLTE